MKSIRGFIGSMLALLVIVALVLSCAPQPAPSPTPTPTPSPTPAAPIKIGAILSLTGYMAESGAVEKSALEYRLDEIGWKAGDRKIEYIVEDDAADPIISVDKAKKLVESDKVDVVLGPLNSACAFAVSDYLKKSKIPNMHFLQNPIEVLQFGGGNVWLWSGTLKGTGYYMGLYSADKLGYRTATGFYADFVSGQDFVGGAQQGFEEKGGTVVQKQAIPMDTMDFSPYLAAMKKADCTFIWFTPAVCLRFVQQYLDAGVKAPLIIPGAMVLFPMFLAEIGDRSQGIIGSLPYTALIDTDINKRYVDGFVKKVGFAPPAESIGSDTALIMYLEAVKATGGDTTPDKINAALKKVKADTPAGNISFRADGLGIANLYISEVVKLGEGAYGWKPIYTYEQIAIDVPK